MGGRGLVSRIKKSENCYLSATCSLLHPTLAPVMKSKHKARAMNRNDQSGYKYKYAYIYLDLRIYIFAFIIKI